MKGKWWTLTAVVAGVFMLLLDVTIVNVALADIQTAFGASLSDLQWVLDAYALTLAAALLTAGSLADLLGRRSVFAAGTALFTVASLLCGLATGPLSLSLARGLQGVGGAMMFATSIALLNVAYRGRDRGLAFGIFGAVTGVAVATGPVLGGLIISGLDWRWIFLVNIPIGIATIAVTLSKVTESRDPHAASPDWIGFATFSGGLGALIYGLINSVEGWTEPRVVVSLATAAVLLTTFVIAEAVQRRPMLDLSLFRKPTFTGGLIAAFGISAALFAMLTYIVLYLQNQLGYSALETGVRTLFLTLAIFLVAGAAGRLTTVLPARAMISTGFVLIGTGLLLMRGITVTSEWTHLIPGLILAGAGAGLVNVPLVSTAVGVVEPARSGMASGINSTFRQVGIATGIATLGSLFAAQMRDSVTDRLLNSPLSAQANQIAEGTTTVTGPARELVAAAHQAGFVDGLNRILLIGATVAFVSAATSLALIRGRDFVEDITPQPSTAPEPAHAIAR